MSGDEVEVVLTPLKGIVPGSHVMRIERIPASQLNKANVHHFAGGPYQGIIINKATEEETTHVKPDSQRMFTAYVADPKKETQEFTREKRVLKFWFEELAKVDTQVTEAITDTYFKELMNKDNFPKDYINFVKRVLNLVKQFSAILKLELIMRKLLEGEDDEGMVMNKTMTRLSKTVVTSTSTTRTLTNGAGQDDYRRLADGTIVDSHGNIVTNGVHSTSMPSDKVVIMKNGKIQEDLRLLADGTVIDSHGSVVTYIVDVMVLTRGGELTPTRRQPDGSIVDSTGNVVANGSEKIVIRRNGKAQDDLRLVADGTIVDSHGNIITGDAEVMVMTKGGQLTPTKRQPDGSLVDSRGNVIIIGVTSIVTTRTVITKNGKAQDDLRMLADGTVVDSHGEIQSGDIKIMQMTQGLVLSKPQEDKLRQQGFDFSNMQGGVHSTSMPSDTVVIMKNGKIQEDLRLLADGTVIDTHGSVVTYNVDVMVLTKGGELTPTKKQRDGSIVDSSGNVVANGSEKIVIMRNGKAQDDLRLVADGTIVDSHGNIITGDAEVMVMTKGGQLTPTNRQPDGSLVDSRGKVIIIGVTSIVTTRTVITKNGKAQDDLRMLADGTVVDSHGEIQSGDIKIMRMTRGLVLSKPQEEKLRQHGFDFSNMQGGGAMPRDTVVIMKSGKVQEDLRLLAEGKVIDSHGSVVTSDVDVMVLTKGGELTPTKKQRDGSIVDSSGNFVANGSEKIVITRNGKAQDDLRLVADGTIVNSYGNIISDDAEVMLMTKGGKLTPTKTQPDGSLVDSRGKVIIIGVNSITTTRTVITKNGKAQDDLRLMADGTVVDPHGEIQTGDIQIMRMTRGLVLSKAQEEKLKEHGFDVSNRNDRLGGPGGGAMPRDTVVIMKSGKVQEDLRLLADGTVIDSHGSIVTSDVDVMVLTKGGELTPTRRQPDGSIVDSSGNVVAAANGVNSEKLVIMRNGKAQEDLRLVADGTIVDSHGTIISGDAEVMLMTKGGQMTPTKRQPDGSLVDSCGKVIIIGVNSITTTRTVITRNGKAQDDLRLLADGTVVDSHGEIQTGDIQIMRMTRGLVLSKEQEEKLKQHGFDVSNIGDPAAARRGQLKKQTTITRKGWDLIWATKKQRLIQILEDAYPTVMTMDDLVRHSDMKKNDVEYLMDDLTKRGLVKDVDKNRFIRIPEGRKLVIRQGTTQRSSRQSADLDSTLDRSGTMNRSMDEETKKRSHEFKMVAHIPHLPAKDQPTIALITLLFCEKVAVDAMMDTKTTYIRIKKGEGEGQVYTVGKIGPHIVVSTKLSRIGHGESAMMAAGNTVTRLLGTFGQIEHVILVGVGGGVINLDDETKHVRLGDVVVSKVVKPTDPAYIHCNEMDENNGKMSFKNKTWTPKDFILEKIMLSLKRKSSHHFFSGEFAKYLNEGLEELNVGDNKYARPSPESDKLYKVEANKEVEIEHPKSPAGAPERDASQPLLYLGKIGAGKMLSKNDSIRQAFTESTDCICIDSGFQAVMQSIEGNRKDSFAVIRGISDYQDGTHRREWQPYASLVAAAFMKAVILQLSHEDEDEDD